MQGTLRSNRFDKWLLQKVRHAIGEAPVRLVLARIEEDAPPKGTPVATVFIRDRQTLTRLALDPEIGFGEGYTEGRIEVEGDLVGLLEAVSRGMQKTNPGRWYSRLVSRWLDFTQNNTARGSRRNIQHHYDLNVDFYKLWLDSLLVYTCAYFPTPSATLEEAQLAKMDHVCRKAQLQAGEKVVEAGCGWGALALHMAKNYGVSVKAFNISHEQIQYARERAEKEGLSQQVEFIEDDYRSISGQFDVFMSVGMLEHVGAEHYHELGRVIHRTVGDSGRGLLHFIGRNRPRPFSAWTRKHIFPGAYAPALREVMDILEPRDYAVLDVENLRAHYAKTLEHWLNRYERSAERVSKMLGPEFVRAWRVYLAGSMASFRVRSLQLFQVVFAGRACQRIPWTRAYLYREGAPAEKETRWMHAMP